MSTGKRLSKADKIRLIRQLIRIVRDPNKFHKSKGFFGPIIADGLCPIIRRYIGWPDGEYLFSLVPKRTRRKQCIKEKRWTPYIWDPGVKAPRIRFLQEQINKLEGKK